MVSLPEKKDNKKKLARESLKTQKAREKLRRRMETMDAKITREALKQKTLEIHRWISRHADHRVILKSKSISLFDENQNAEKTSQKISKLIEKLQEEYCD